MVMNQIITALGRRARCKSKSGQAMVEYVVIVGALFAVVVMLCVFLGTFEKFGTRVLNLIGSEYP